jgi:hypothetical protein
LNLLELKKQAGIDDNPDQEGLDLFAELIVQECASRVDNILREKKDGGGTMGDKIREHFGVEE